MMIPDLRPYRVFWFAAGIMIGGAAVSWLITPDSATAPPLPDYGAIYETSSPIGTTSFLPVMMGLGTMCQITPDDNGTVEFKLIGVIVNYSPGDGAMVQMRYGTGVAPSNGSFDVGTPSGQSVYAIGNLVTLYNIKAKVKGLTRYTPYWFDAALNADNGGLARIESLKCEASED